MIQQLMVFGTGTGTGSIPALSTTGNINNTGGQIEDAFDGSLSTKVWRSQEISTNNHTGSMIFTWSTAFPVYSSIRIAVAMASSSNRSTAVNITDAAGNVHSTTVTNQSEVGGNAVIPLANLNSSYPYFTIKKIEFFNSHNPAAVAAIEIDGSILIY